MVRSPRSSARVGSGGTRGEGIHGVIELYARDAEILSDALASELLGERVAAG
jgi:hypothetical protein